MYCETNIIYISAKMNMHKIYFDIITTNTIFYEIKRTNYLYGNVIS